MPVKQGWKKVFETDKDTKEEQEKDIALPKVAPMSRLRTKKGEYFSK